MLASDLHRHDWRTPGLQGIQCHPHGGGSPVQADSCHPHSHLLGLCRSRPVVPGACLVPPQTSGGSDQRPQTCIHGQLLARTSCPPWAQLTSLHFLPPPTSSPHKLHKPKNQPLSPILPKP